MIRVVPASRPIPGTPIDTSHPLASGLLLASTFNAGGGSLFRDAFYGQRIGTIDAATQQLTVNGLYTPTSVTATNGAGIDITANAQTVTRFTVAWRGTVEGAVTNGRVAIVRGTTLYGIAVSNAPALVPVWNNSGLTGWSDTLTITANVDTAVVMVIEPTLATLYIWQEGVGLRILTRSGTYASQSWSGTARFGGDTVNNNLIHRGLTSASAFWERALSPAESLQWVFDPYGMYEPLLFERADFGDIAPDAGNAYGVIGSRIIGSAYRPASGIIGGGFIK